MNDPHCNINVPDVVKIVLKAVLINICKWYFNDRLKSDIGVCPFLSSLDINSDITRETSIRTLNFLKLLGVKTNTNLNFNEHVSKLCKKAGKKIAALAR